MISGYILVTRDALEPQQKSIRKGVGYSLNPWKRQITDSFLKTNFMNTNKISACSWGARVPSEALLGRYKLRLQSARSFLEIFPFSDYFLPFQSMFWKVWKLPDSRFVLEHYIRIRKRCLSFLLLTTKLPVRLQIYHYAEFLQILTWKGRQLCHS